MNFHSMVKNIDIELIVKQTKTSWAEALICYTYLTSETNTTPSITRIQPNMTSINVVASGLNLIFLTN